MGYIVFSGNRDHKLAPLNILKTSTEKLLTNTVGNAILYGKAECVFATGYFRRPWVIVS